MSEPYIGQINMFAGNFAPRNFTLCQGQLLPISQYTAVFAILGTTYGGDGRTTFGMPNLQSRAPMHWGTGPGLTTRRLGETGGTNTVTLTQAQNAAHNHSIVAGSAANANAPASTVGIGNAQLFAAPSSPAVPMNANAIGDTGGGQSHENRQPYLAINFIIALAGIFPPRN